MVRQSVTYYLAEESRLNEVSLNEIKQWSDAAPYSQPLRILLAKKLRSLQSYKLTEAISKVAARISNRVCLYRHLFVKDYPESRLNSCTEEACASSEEILEIAQPNTLAAEIPTKDIDQHESITEESKVSQEEQIVQIEERIQHAVASIDHLSLQNVTTTESSAPSTAPIAEVVAVDTEEEVAELIPLVKDHVESVETTIEEKVEVIADLSNNKEIVVTNTNETSDQDEIYELQARPELHAQRKASYINDNSSLSSYGTWLLSYTAEKIAREEEAKELEAHILQASSAVAPVKKKEKKKKKAQKDEPKGQKKKDKKEKKKEKKKDKNKSDKLAKATKKEAKKKKKAKLEALLEKSVTISHDIVSEPWADLLAQQGHIKEASQMYKLLGLRDKKKSAYFAAKSENLKKKK